MRRSALPGFEANQMDEQQKLNEFEAATYEAWLKLAERDLQGASFDKKLVKRIAGIDVQPLYTRESAPAETGGLPGFSPFTRGSHALGAAEMGWDVRQEVAQAEPATAAQSVLDNLNGGTSSLVLVLDRAARLLDDGHGQGGISVANLNDLASVLEHVDLEKVPVSLQAGASSGALSAGLIALARQRGARTTALSGSLGVDPLATLAGEGKLPGSLASAYDQAAALATWTGAHASSLRVLSVDTAVYHEAGADAASEIAIALATGVEYLRALTSRGLDVDTALSQLQFGFSIGRDFFLEIAKLRAARRAWAQVATAAGGKPESEAMLIHARTSLRTKTRRDPWVNMLRGTAESFSAAVGGADAITTHSFDVLLGAPDEFGERMARNTQHLLRHESNLHRVVDPAGGSWYVEALTEGLVMQAWQRFQEIERAGGLAAALTNGSLQAQLKGGLDQDEKAVATRKISITGVNEFANVKEEPVLRATPATAALKQRSQQASQAGKAALESLGSRHDFTSLVEAVQNGAAFRDLASALATGDAESVHPLTRRRLAEPFELLRDQADAQLKDSGQRPRIFLANLGPIPEHKARAGYAQNFFEAGGFEVLGNEGFLTALEAAEAFASSGASVCAICSSDAIYAELAESTAQALTARGARAVVLAGAAGEREAAYRAAGVTDFIFVGQNLVTTLRALLSRAGVL